MDLTFDISQDELPVFLAETDELLQVLDEGLVQLEREDSDQELMQALFRAAHTLKGMAGMIGHRRLVEINHALENLFDAVRKNQIAITTPLIDICLEAVDALRELRTEVITRQASTVSIDLMVSTIHDFLSQDQDPIMPVVNVEPVVVVSNEPAPPSETGNQGKLWIRADISANSIASAARAFQLMMTAMDHGQIESMSPSQEVIESVAPVSRFEAVIITNDDLEKVRKDLLSISEVDQVWVWTSAPQVDTRVVEQKPPAVTVAETASVKKPATEKTLLEKPKETTVDKTVRTSVERLDSLMNLVGELITDRNRLNQLRTHLETTFRADEKVAVLSETVTHIGRITDQLQEEVMRIRMVPVSNVFNRFPRLVRDLAQKTNKEIDLQISGQDTEMDRSVIEEINDPLIHLIRNSIDHGIETVEDRIAAGKDRRGIITLTARHEQGRIIITVGDDGKGINIEKIKNAAVTRGILTEAEAAALSQEKAIDLIFASGLSTARAVTDISGRGVGMDIVRTHIERINGTIVVETQPGQGTRFEIVLPLTLAIVPTLLVRVGIISIAVPLVMVLETLRLGVGDIQTVNNREVTILRNRVLPLIKLDDLFSMPISQKNQDRANSYVVVVGNNKVQVGLVVDALIGEEEVVVKSMGTLIGEVPGISSAAILGDGQVALIADIQGIFKLAGVH